MITIKEIASKLGLSTTTVSNVIHGKTKEVSADTIERVQKFLEEVEYVPNINARNLAQGQSKIIGVVLKSLEFRLWHSDNILSDPFVSEMIGGIEKAVREAGYYMMLYISDDIAEIIQHISIWNVDGLILFCMMDDDANRVAAKYHKPMVCIDTYSTEKSDDFINVGLDDEQGVYEAVRYLIDSGHTKIGFLTDNRVGVDRARFWGFRRALKEAGIEYSDRSFFLLKPDRDNINGNIEKLCKKARDYTAIFCCSDIYAVLMMAALKDRGFRIPEDISIIGFDDNLYSRICTPRLTTVHQDAAEKGRVAAGILIDQIRGKAPASKEVRLHTHLEIRETVKIIPAIDCTENTNEFMQNDENWQ